LILILKGKQIMKKTLFTVLILGMAQIAVGADGTINFTGKIVDNTCAVNTASQNLTVTLPTVNKSSLDVADRTAGLTLFSIQLDSCDGKNILAYFEPTPGKVDFNSGRVINTNTTTGSSVEIELLDSDATRVLQLSENDGHQNAQRQSITAANNKLRYFARYRAKQTAVAGDVAGSVDYTISYE
ncbi:fimbrial protein, partial [Avibacterium paragallinarum]